MREENQKLLDGKPDGFNGVNKAIQFYENLTVKKQTSMVETRLPIETDIENKYPNKITLDQDSIEITYAPDQSSAKTLNYRVGKYKLNLLFSIERKYSGHDLL